jgi:hypothetical protein
VVCFLFTTTITSNKPVYYLEVKGHFASADIGCGNCGGVFRLSLVTAAQMVPALKCKQELMSCYERPDMLIVSVHLEVFNFADI